MVKDQRSYSIKARRDVLIALYKNGSWMLTSHIAGKILQQDKKKRTTSKVTNHRGVVKEICEDFVKDGYAEEDPDSKDFDKSTSSAFRITQKGRDKVEAIKHTMDERKKLAEPHKGFIE